MEGVHVWLLIAVMGCALSCCFVHGSVATPGVDNNLTMLWLLCVFQGAWSLHREGGALVRLQLCRGVTSDAVRQVVLPCFACWSLVLPCHFRAPSYSFAQATSKTYTGQIVWAGWCWQLHVV